MNSQLPVLREVNIDNNECVVTIAQAGKSTWSASGFSIEHSITQPKASDPRYMKQEEDK